MSSKAVMASCQGGLDDGIIRRFAVLPLTGSIPESKRVPAIAKRILEQEKKLFSRWRSLVQPQYYIVASIRCQRRWGRLPRSGFRMLIV